MKKNKLELSIIIGIVCIILVSIMLAQFKSVEETNVAGIEAAREEELQAMLSSWKTKYEEIEEKLQDTNNKIIEYTETINSNKQADELLQEELEQSNLLAGKTNVIGDGVIVTLQDNEETSIEASDLRTLVNELRLAGAEAISINNKRILNMSEIVFAGGRIFINEEPTTSPYTVKAIGDQTYLSSALSLKTSGFIDSNTKLGKTVNMRKERNITIEAYKGSKNLMQFKYAKEVEE